MKSYKKHVKYPVIIAAINGQAEEINEIINHYQAYIRKASIIKVLDEYGNKKSAVDVYLSKLLEVQLVTAILKFKTYLYE